MGGLNLPLFREKNTNRIPGAKALTTNQMQYPLVTLLDKNVLHVVQ